MNGETVRKKSANKVFSLILACPAAALKGFGRFVRLRRNHAKTASKSAKILYSRSFLILVSPPHQCVVTNAKPLEYVGIIYRIYRALVEKHTHMLQDNSPQLLQTLF